MSQIFDDQDVTSFLYTDKLGERMKCSGLDVDSLIKIISGPQTATLDLARADGTLTITANKIVLNGTSGGMSVPGDLFVAGQINALPTANAWWYVGDAPITVNVTTDLDNNTTVRCDGTTFCVDEQNYDASNSQRVVATSQYSSDKYYIGYDPSLPAYPLSRILVPTGQSVKIYFLTDPARPSDGPSALWHKCYANSPDSSHALNITMWDTVSGLAKGAASSPLPSSVGLANTVLPPTVSQARFWMTSLLAANTMHYVELSCATSDWYFPVISGVIYSGGSYAGGWTVNGVSNLTQTPLFKVATGVEIAAAAQLLVYCSLANTSVITEGAGDKFCMDRSSLVGSIKNGWDTASVTVFPPCSQLSTELRLRTKGSAAQYVSMNAVSNGDLMIDCQGNDASFASTDVVHVLGANNVPNWTGTGDFICEGYSVSKAGLWAGPLIPDVQVTTSNMLAPLITRYGWSVVDDTSASTPTGYRFALSRRDVVSTDSRMLVVAYSGTLDGINFNAVDTYAPIFNQFPKSGQWYYLGAGTNTQTLAVSSSTNNVTKVDTDLASFKVDYTNYDPSRNARVVAAPYYNTTHTITVDSTSTSTTRVLVPAGQSAKIYFTSYASSTDGAAAVGIRAHSTADITEGFEYFLYDTVAATYRAKGVQTFGPQTGYSMSNVPPATNYRFFMTGLIGNAVSCYVELKSIVDWYIYGIDGSWAPGFTINGVQQSIIPYCTILTGTAAAGNATLLTYVPTVSGVAYTWIGSGQNNGLLCLQTGSTLYGDVMNGWDTASGTYLPATVSNALVSAGTLQGSNASIGGQLHLTSAAAGIASMFASGKSLQIDYSSYPMASTVASGSPSIFDNQIYCPTGSYLTCYGDSSVLGVNTGCVSFWLTPAYNGNPATGIICKIATPGSNANGIQLYMSSGGQLWLWLYDSSGANVYNAVLGSAYTAVNGAPMHIEIDYSIYPSSASAVRLFRNGTLLGTATNQYTRAAATALILGSNSGTYPFTGSYSGIRCWPTVQHTAGGFTPPPFNQMESDALTYNSTVAPSTGATLFISGKSLIPDFSVYPAATPIYNSGATIVSGALSLNGSFYGVYIDNSVLGINYGTMSCWYNPSYTGSPATDTYIMRNMSGFYSGNASLISLQHKTDGNLYLTFYDQSAVLKFSTSMYAYSAVAGTPVHLEIDYNAPANSLNSAIALFVNGTQQGGTLTTTMTRNASAYLFVLGSTTGAAASYTYAQCWSTVQHTSDFTATAPADLALTKPMWNCNVPMQLKFGYITPFEYGAIGDGVADDTAAVQAAAYVAKFQGRTLHSPRGIFNCASPIDLRYCAIEMSNAKFLVNNSAGPGMLLGGNAYNGVQKCQSIGIVTGNTANSRTTPVVRCIGMVDMEIKIISAHVQIYADGTGTYPDPHYIQYFASAYSRFESLMGDLEIYMIAGGWVNENQFYLHRSHNLIIDSDGTTQCDHNKFYDGTFEGTCAITFNGCWSNHLIGPRFENGPITISFGPGSYENSIVCTDNWSTLYCVSSAPNASPYTVTDNGSNNAVYNIQERNTDEHSIFSLGPTTPFISTINKGVTGYTTLNNTTDVKDVGNIIHHLDGSFTMINQWGAIWSPPASEMIPVKRGDMFYFKGDVVKFLFYAKFYDVNKTRITDQPTAAAAISFRNNLTWYGSGYTLNLGAAVDLSDTWITIVDDTTVKYVLFTITAGQAVGVPNSTFRSILLTTRNMKAGNCPRQSVYDQPSRRLRSLRYISASDIDMRQIGQDIVCQRNDGSGATMTNVYRGQIEITAVTFDGVNTTVTLASNMPYSSNMAGIVIPFYESSGVLTNLSNVTTVSNGSVVFTGAAPADLVAGVILGLIQIVVTGIQSLPVSPTVYADTNVVAAADVISGVVSYSSAGGTLNMPAVADLYAALQVLHSASVGFALTFKVVASDNSSPITLSAGAGYTVTGVSTFNYWAELSIVVTGASTFRIYITTR